MKDKIAIVVQRYGLEINGGAEFHARLLAEKLSANHHLEVITTCAIEYEFWNNHYPEGTETINNITVRRFKTLKKDLNKFNRLSKFARNLYKYGNQKLSFLNFPYLLLKRFKYKKKNFNFNTWLEVQGPYSTDLIEFIKAKKDDYRAFIFFTYLYHPTNIGIKEVAEKSILIPTAHDEPQFYLDGYRQLFSSPKFIMYNTETEKDLVEKVYPQTKDINSEIAGIGFDDYDNTVGELPQYLSPKKYFVYIGRIVEDKGCVMMIEYFNDFKKKHSDVEDLKLVLVGKNSLDEKLLQGEDIILTGFVDDQLKNTLLKNACALIMPSFYESLSLVTLEAMFSEIPVIVNRNCEVLYAHVEKSDTGKSFKNSSEFSEALHFYLNNKDLLTEGTKAKNYVLKNYSWNAVINKYDSVIKSL
ncbi:D-inositol-3-phosphate glycosyltransferase [Chryseobacterium aquaeductus]|uniref:D-inositol-3-phosphate glycosyltransferase n=1 Tax=Chryseobacterium aquaeductus TaxID=2675056 RepID=A0A9N8MNX3_9FLAO|nr:glycosyltransferase family 4 protein [Chryseobacterium aquaeductus]CAA7331193.1 D-inositol-3-phosphate glycosyltransferase [Chryseobacterium potabilaquae]CAD7808736.1 D-inositol-3-phosphate glycosyltransferase [Chryseobacterium aquaeductus]